MKRQIRGRAASTGRFQDRVKVHTAPSGTQYVHPIDVFFSEEETRRYVEEARSGSRRPVLSEKQ